QFDQLRDHVAQLVDLALSRNMARDAARILNVLLAVEHLPDALPLRPHRVPHVHGEDEGATAAGCRRKSPPSAWWGEFHHPNRVRHGCVRPERPAAARLTP